MRRNSARLVGVIAFGVSALIAVDAYAWCRTTTDDTFYPTPGHPCSDQGSPLGWTSRCVGFDVQRDADDGPSGQGISLETARAIVTQAFQNWSSADCPSNPVSCDPADHTGKHPSIAISDLGPVDCDHAEYNQKSGNANIIVFHDTWPDDEQHGDPTTTLALTTVTFDKGTGEIYDADIEINSDKRYATLTTSDTNVVYDLASILQHETGHFLGLAHTQPSNTAAVMYPQYKEGATFMRALSADDVCGICAAYDPTRATTCDPTPRRGLALGCHGNDIPDANKGCHCGVVGRSEGAQWALAGVSALFVVGVMRRRRR